MIRIRTMTYDEDAMDLNRDGYAIHRRVVSPDACQSIGQEIVEAFASQSEGAIETSRGGLVGGRNLMTLWQGWRIRRCTDASSIWRSRRV
jgi:hypothetical protein